MPARRRPSAFTLLELVLVLVLISVTLAIAAPSLQGWSRASRLRDATDQFLAVARWARTHSIQTGRTCRLTIDPAAGAYRVNYVANTATTEIRREEGRVFTLPDGFRIDPPDAGDGPRESIDFYPTGRTQPSVVRIWSTDGTATAIECPSPAEDFAVVKPEGRP